jgi:DNA-binding NarL/FixJ family response regulator
MLSYLSLRERGSMRILVAERNIAVRSALGMFVERQPGFDVVGEAADAGELLALADLTRPDLVLLDWDLCDASAAELVRALRRLDWEPSVIVLDVQSESAEAALAAGAQAFVSKANPPVELLSAIQATEPQGGQAQ